MINFVGAGPGDPDLITVKGMRLVEEADLIIYAGSLVSKEHLKRAKEGCEIYNSAKMDLEEIIEIMADRYKKGKKVVRLHTGDPGIYGAIGEQMRELDKLEIPYQVVPGVSSFLAANASLKKEMTLPNISQTIIITRMAGRTGVPDKEKLSELAKHRASMAIFLSIHDIETVVDQLLEGYSEDTPIAVIYKASWEEEKKVIGKLSDIASKVKEAGITKTAMILVGDFIDTDFEYSKLYDPGFTTEFRKARK